MCCYGKRLALKHRAHHRIKRLIFIRFIFFFYFSTRSHWDGNVNCITIIKSLKIVQILGSFSEEQQKTYVSCHVHTLKNRRKFLIFWWLFSFHLRILMNWYLKGNSEWISWEASKWNSKLVRSTEFACFIVIINNNLIDWAFLQ